MPADLGCIAHYELLEEIGRGGQGVVYRARDQRLKRIVALKVLDRPLQRSEQMLQRFRREAEVAARLDHPGICTVLDSGIDEASGVTYIAMRHVEGESLAEQIAGGVVGGPVDREGVRRIAVLCAKAARALHVAHEAGIVHRDIKPANIMVTADGEPVLLDFGLARDETEGVVALTESGDVFGTPAYMSPEQLRGQSSLVDRRTDVYALGATLHEALTGQPPFVAPTREGLYRAILERDPVSPQRISSAVPFDLAVITLTALEKDLARRYASAAALADDLERFDRNEPIAARPVSVRTRTWRWVQRNRGVAALASLLIVVLATSLVVISFQNRELASELEDARAGRLSKRQQEVQSLTERGFMTLFGGNQNGADVLFDEVLALDPSSKSALVGRFWYDIVRPEQAMAVLDRFAPQSAATDAEVLWMRGLVLEIGGDTTSAQAYYERAGEQASALRSFLQGLRRTRGFYSGGSEKARQAIPFFREAIALAGAPQFHYHYCLLFAAMQADDRATMDATAAVMEHHWRGSPALLEAVAFLYFDIDRPRAVAALHRLHEVQPSALACIGLAKVALAAGDQEQAMVYYDEGVALDPEFVSVRYMRGMLLQEGGEVARARADFMASLERQVEFFLAAQDLVESYLAEGEIDAATTFLDTWAPKVQDVPMARDAAARLRVRCREEQARER